MVNFKSQCVHIGSIDKIDKCSICHEIGHEPIADPSSNSLHIIIHACNNLYSLQGPLI